MSILKTIVLGALLAAPMMASAANIPNNLINPGTFDLGLVTEDDDVTLGATVPFGTGIFIDTWDFTVGGTSFASATLTATSAKISSNLSGLSAFVDANPLSLDFSVTNPKGGISQQFSAFIPSIAPGPHFFTIFGIAPISKNGAYSATLSVAPVPVPAAVWLMGSALVGLVSFGRRKIGLAA